MKKCEVNKKKIFDDLFLLINFSGPQASHYVNPALAFRYPKCTETVLQQCRVQKIFQVWHAGTPALWEGRGGGVGGVAVARFLTTKNRRASEPDAELYRDREFVEKFFAEDAAI
jgi:hypothetical protein